MKKIYNEGFVLLETLIVTVFISSVLLFLFIQFNTLNKNYEESYDYNSVEKIYALNNISNYILNDWNFYQKIESNTDDYINITDCSMFSNVDFCKKIYSYEDIDTIFVTKNTFDKNAFLDYDDDIRKFIQKISPIGNEKYRLIAKFNSGEFATVRFGDKNE